MVQQAFGVGEEVIPRCANRDGGVGEAARVKCSELAATVPALEFFEHDAFNIRLLMRGKRGSNALHLVGVECD